MYKIDIKNTKEIYDFCLLNKILDIDEFINKDVDFKMGSWKSVISSKEIPEIIITIYVLDEYDLVDEIEFSDLIDEIDFLMNVLFPRVNKGRYTAVWVLDVEQQ